MGLSLSLFIFLISQLHLVCIESSPLTQHLCHDHERLALLQFKQSFILTKNASSDDPRAYPKVTSWKLEGNKSDCCFWDGVDCDKHTGHVIGLNLQSSFLYGSINSNNSLFRLVHLQELNLANNDFNNSQIPSQVRNLSRLKKLDLSWSGFSGGIPSEISQLSHLTSLDLSRNELAFYPRNASLRRLIGNLTHLEKLDLWEVNISSTMPDIVTNMTSLVSLYLSFCGLYGEIPIGIFKLPNLQNLAIEGNKGIIGSLPDFTWSTPLKVLDLSGTSFSGELPDSIGNLDSLIFLAISGCNFTGSMPSSLGNLTKLTFLDLSHNAFVGEVVFGLMIETKLTILDLHDNHLTGPIIFGHCNQLRYLLISANEIHGQISNSIFNLKNLVLLDFSNNHFSGTLEFTKFFKLKCLVSLHLFGNKLSLLIEEPTSNTTIQNFEALGLSSCNLREFPSFLRNQKKLEYLNLSNNNIHGQVPNWVWNISKTRLIAFDLSYNFLTSLGQHPVFGSWIHLKYLNLNSNFLQGSLPIPPFSTLYFSMSSNFLIGNIPKIFCNLSSLQILDLEHNNLSGPIPSCLGSSNDLSILNLRRNKFQGSISSMWTKGNKLRMIMLSQNKFQGQLPRSLTNFSMLKVLDLSNNQFLDSFPFWLGLHPNLEVLNLHSNNLYGLVGTFGTYFRFPNLRILDISHNSFTGKLPTTLFENWKARKFEDLHELRYIDEELEFSIPIGSQFFSLAQSYKLSIMLTNKGMNMFYEKVQEGLLAIDFSSNKFDGEIPESIGNLRECNLLNLSNNAFIGQIPLSMGNLSKLEALDLSQNQLVGEIPQQLTQLTFLEFFNVSHNNLSGLIPQGKQFNTFGIDSFKGNPGLFGIPLTKKCINPTKPYTQFPILKELEESQDFAWKITAIGYGIGLIFGGVIGHISFVRNQDWLMKTFKIRKLGRRGC